MKCDFANISTVPHLAKYVSFLEVTGLKIKSGTNTLTSL